MAVLLGTMEVENYEQWKNVFNEGAQPRREHGLTAEKVYRDRTTPTPSP